MIQVEQFYYLISHRKKLQKMDLSIAYKKEWALNSEKPQGKIRENDENENTISLVHAQ